MKYFRGFKFPWADRSFWQLQWISFLVRFGWDCAYPFVGVFLHITLGVQLKWVGVFFALGVLVPVLFSKWFGVLLDRGKGWRYIPLAMAALFIVSSVAFFLFKNLFWFLCFAYVILGIARSALSIYLSAYIAKNYPKEAKFEAFGFNYFILNLAAAGGAFLGAKLFAVSNSWAFFGMMFFIILGAILLCFFKGKFSPNHPVQEIDVTRPEIVSVRENTSQTIAESTASSRMPKRLVYFLLARIFYNAAFSQMFVTFSLIPQASRPTSWEDIFSHMFMINVLGVVFLQQPMTTFHKDIGIKNSLTLSSVFIVIGFIIMSVADNRWLFYLTAVFMTLSELFFFPIMQVLLDRLAPSHQKGMYFGLSNIGAVGRGLAPIIGTVLLSYVTQWEFCFVFVAILAMMAYFLYQVMKGMKTEIT